MTTVPPGPVVAARSRFPGLADGWARLDGPAGSQVLDTCAEAVGAFLAGTAIANVHAASAASVATGELVDEARGAVAPLLGAEADRVVFGPSATALLGRLASALAPRVAAGDEIVCTDLDHDANVSPWLELAHDRGATIRFARAAEGTLDLPASAVEAVLGARTRIVAVTGASNVTGTIPDLEGIVAAAHRVGAVVVVDAVHAVPHGLPPVGADAVVTSAYKWFGPHVSALGLSAELMDELRPPRIRPAPARGPEAWERGTLPFELLPGVIAAARYVRELDWAAAGAHEAALRAAVVEGLAAVPGVRLLGAPARATATVSFNVDGVAPARVAAALAERRVAVNHGTSYAVEAFARLGLDGGVRAGLLHYNDDSDVARLLEGVWALTG